MSKYSQNDDDSGWTQVGCRTKRKTRQKNNQSSWKDHAKSLSAQKETDKDIAPVKEFHQLNDTWILWFHDTKGNDWTINGYEKLFEFDTVEDFWILYNSLVRNKSDITSGMYYLMRHGYPPIWDDPKNVNGGGWTFKIDKRNVPQFWEDISCFCIGESICDDSENVVGLSVSPKIRFATVRVWTSDKDQSKDKFSAVYEHTKNSNIVIDFEHARFTPNSGAAT